DKEPVEAALNELKAILEGEDLDAIKQKTEALGQASQAFFQKVYEQAAAQQESAEGSEGETAGDNDDDVVDAEIVEDDQ
ncbi:MAG: molecular chaperone DnaK, partial [Actinobacteria bacterium]|nr:molecular chaperone DnaK [Actinomycetota bacterium]